MSGVSVRIEISYKLHISRVDIVRSVPRAPHSVEIASVRLNARSAYIW